MIVCGGGIFGAEAELLELAEILQAPVIMTRSRFGGRSVPAITWRLNETEGYHVWAKADAVLAVGTRLYGQYRDWGIEDELKIVRIDVDQDEIDRNGKPSVGIESEAKPALASIVNSVGRYNQRRSSRQDELGAIKAQLQAEYDKLSPADRLYQSDSCRTPG